MAKTQSDLDRSEKEQKILMVAHRMFTEAGYEASSIQRIAEEARVAPNTIYWYFADKDALLIAVLNGLLARAMRDYEKRKQGSVEAQMMWLLGELDGARNLIASVHARVSLAEAVRTWHTNFHVMLETMLITQLRTHGVAPSDFGHASRVGMFVLEGLLAHPSSTKDRRALVRWLVSRVVSGVEPGADD